MTYETLKRLTKKESELVLGAAFIELSAQKLNVKSSDLSAEILSYINTPIADSKIASFYDFLIEIICLTYELHKLGMLLFHLDYKMYGNYLLGVEVKNDMYLARDRGRLTLENIHNGEVIFEAEFNAKSALYKMLDFLRKNDAAIEIIAVENSEDDFSGNRVSFTEKVANEKTKETLIIREEFARYKTRLNELNKIFVENLGNPFDF
ncbi:MAG: hypothetical protein LBU73_00265 [Helicobacteraceae bacterium]|jgi:hypothetical protein|nr:hypothetical protein [Helicobacteraceae bacterium]